jgi:hypothetical protein
VGRRDTKSTTFGSETAVTYSHDVAAVFEAALITPAQQVFPPP